MTAINTVDTATGNITTDSIRNLRDLGRAYYEACGHLEDPEFIDGFRDVDGDIDFEALIENGFDNLPTPGEFIQDEHSYTSGGRTVYSAFTWFRDAFDAEFWAAIEAAYPPSQSAPAEQVELNG